MVKNQSVKADTTAGRRDRLRDALVAAAEDTIAKGGLGEMRARDLAEKAGCAVGAIYNAVEDLDQLVLLVNVRTLAALEHDLTTAQTGERRGHGRLRYRATCPPRARLSRFRDG